MARHRRAFAFSARVSQVGVSSKAELEMRALGRVRLAPTVTRGATLALAAALLVPPLAAQLPAADEAFRKGDYAAARAGYERVSTRDSLSGCALYRLAILDSWDGKLARSLARFGRLRRLDPKDGDFMVAQAQVLAWAGKTRASEALYDSALARSPDRTDALAGRARAVAWGGDLDRAEQLWRAALTRHPDDAELLIGLAQTLYWKGQPGLAEAYAARARALAPEDRVARDLERAVRAALRPEAGTKVDGANDSDHNRFVAQEATVATSLGPDVRGTLQAGSRRATGPVPGDTIRRSGTSYGAAGQLVAAPRPRPVVRARPGVRPVEPEAFPGPTPLTAQLGVGLRPGRYPAVNVPYSRTPFDETAGLMRPALVVKPVAPAPDAWPGPARP